MFKVGATTVEVDLAKNEIRCSLNSRKSKNTMHPVYTEKFNDLRQYSIVPCGSLLAC